MTGTSTQQKLEAKPAQLLRNALQLAWDCMGTSLSAVKGDARRLHTWQRQPRSPSLAPVQPITVQLSKAGTSTQHSQRSSSRCLWRPTLSITAGTRGVLAAIGAQRERLRRQAGVGWIPCSFGHCSGCQLPTSSPAADPMHAHADWQLSRGTLAGVLPGKTCSCGESTCKPGGA